MDEIYANQPVNPIYRAKVADIPMRAKGNIHAYLAASTKNEKDSQYSPAEKNPRPNHHPIEKADQEVKLSLFEHLRFTEMRQASINQTNPTNPGIKKGQKCNGGSDNTGIAPNNKAVILRGHPLRIITCSCRFSILEINLLNRHCDVKLRKTFFVLYT